MHERYITELSRKIANKHEQLVLLKPTCKAEKWQLNKWGHKLPLASIPCLKANPLKSQTKCTKKPLMPYHYLMDLKKRKKQPSIVVKAKGGSRRRVTPRFPASIIFFYEGLSWSSCDFLMFVCWTCNPKEGFIWFMEKITFKIILNVLTNFPHFPTKHQRV